MRHLYRPITWGTWGVLLVLLGQSASGAEPFVPAQVAVYFSPNGGATDAVVRALAAAKTQFWCKPTRSRPFPLPRRWWRPINAG